ncbi:winged helix-turn-helix domain-containing protein [Salinadaptatus halalkaliphilus]|nr:winged helix-turn-helix domain-containing protein [Salinadaptatus halalkaliphilus]
MTETKQGFQYLDRGTASEYIETRLFRNSFDDLSSHIKRKKALADEGRYTILYLLYEYGEISRKRLSDETGRVSNNLEQPLRQLLEADLIEKIPGPEGADKRKTYYRITTLGRQEIASDIENIIGGTVNDAYYEVLKDPALDPECDTEERVRRPDDLEILETSSEDLQSSREKLRSQYRQVTATRSDEQDQ